jgi:cysteinyl-tRNA synthetase
MSKSLGNFFTVRDLLDKGIPGEVIRFVMLMTHYRKPMDWTEEKRREAEATLRKWFTLTDGAEAPVEIPGYMVDILNNDLNTPGFLALIHRLANAEKVDEVRAGLQLLGFPQAGNVDWFRGAPHAVSTWGGYHDRLRPLLSEWQRLRDKKQYVEADELKNALEAVGLKLSVTQSGPHADILEGFDPSKLEALK